MNKKPYNSPSVTFYGDVEELTLGGGRNRRRGSDRKDYTHSSGTYPTRGSRRDRGSRRGRRSRR